MAWFIDPNTTSTEPRYVCPSCNHPVSLEMKVCSHCGLVITEGHRVKIAANPEVGPPLNVKQAITVVVSVSLIGLCVVWLSNVGVI